MGIQAIVCTLISESNFMNQEEVWRERDSWHWGHLGGGGENFLQSVRVTLVRTSGNGGYRVWPGHRFVASQGFQLWDLVSLGWTVGWGGPTEIPKQPGLLSGQRLTLWKLTVGPHCPGQLPFNSLNLTVPYVNSDFQSQTSICSLREECSSFCGFRRWSRTIAPENQNLPV